MIFKRQTISFNVSAPSLVMFSCISFFPGASDLASPHTDFVFSEKSKNIHHLNFIILLIMRLSIHPPKQSANKKEKVRKKISKQLIGAAIFHPVYTSPSAYFTQLHFTQCRLHPVQTSPSSTYHPVHISPSAHFTQSIFHPVHTSFIFHPVLIKIFQESFAVF